MRIFEIRLVGGQLSLGRRQLRLLKDQRRRLLGLFAVIQIELSPFLLCRFGLFLGLPEKTLGAFNFGFLQHHRQPVVLRFNAQEGLSLFEGAAIDHGRREKNDLAAHLRRQIDLLDRPDGPFPLDGHGP